VFWFLERENEMPSKMEEDRLCAFVKSQIPALIPSVFVFLSLHFFFLPYAFALFVPGKVWIRRNRSDSFDPV
jgi:hypothetical protein